MSDKTFLEQFSSQYGWKVAPTKRRFRYRKEVNKGMRESHRLALTMKGVVDRALDDVEGLQASDYSTYQIFEEGDLAFKLIDLENIKTSRVGLVPRRGIMSPAYIRLTPGHRDADTRYYAWFFFAVYFNNIFNGMGGGVRQNLTPTDLLEFPIPLPDLATQRQIADFLDRETARIDLLIEKKQRLVALLGERQEVLVEDQLQAVDGSHVQRLKFAIRRIEQGWSPQCEDAPVEGEKWGVLKLGAITTGVYLEEQHKALPENTDPVPTLRVRAGDVLVARASGSPKLVGKAAFVETTSLNLMLSDKHFRLVPDRKKVLPEYLAIVVNSGKSRSQIEDRLSSAEGMARNIGQNVIYGLRCPFPPLAVQERILTTLRLSRAHTHATVTKTNTSINRLK